MVAVATLMLAEQGDLLLNDPVGNYLPDLKDMKVATPRGIEPAHRQPTLQDMLRHTAGVSYGNRGDTPLHKMYETKLKSAANQSGPEFLQELGKLPLHYQPGTQWEYSHGLDVAGLAVEAVSKKCLGEFLQERLFGPLGMADTNSSCRLPRPRASPSRCPSIPDTGPSRGFPDARNAVVVRLRRRLRLRHRARLSALRDDAPEQGIFRGHAAPQP